MNIDGKTGFADRLWRYFVISVPYLWLLIFFLVPFLFVFKISFSDPIIGQPPFTPLFDWSSTATETVLATLDNYRFLTEDNLYWISYLKSAKIASISTLCCLLLGYPMAYGIARSEPTTRNLLLLLVILPFWTSFLLRVYAWMGLLSTYGTVNNLLMWIGLIDAPLKLLYTDYAVYLGIVYTYLPFMILPLYSVMKTIPPSYVHAARSLGASPLTAFIRVYFPQTTPGIGAGVLLVFILAIGYYITPALVGGSSGQLISNQIAFHMLTSLNWSLAAALGGILLFAVIVLYGLYDHFVGVDKMKLG